MTKTPVELKYNRCTRFLLPSLKLREEFLLNMGFVNAYIQDHEYDIRWDLEGCLFLLFKPGNLNNEFEDFSESLRNLSNFRDEYDIQEGVVFVLEIPDKYKNIFNTFVDGTYSKFDKNYIKECIPQYINGKLSKRWKIFYKDKALFEELAQDLGYNNLDIAKEYINELEDKPYAEDEILRYNSEIETKLRKRND